MTFSIFVCVDIWMFIENMEGHCQADSFTIE